MNEELIKLLKFVAQGKCSMDDFDGSGTPDYYCGNFDDCYGMGVDDGKILMARTVLEKLGISYK